MMIYKVCFQDDLDITSNVLLAYMYHLRNRKIYFSVLAKNLNVSEKTIQRKCKELQEKGYLINKKIYNKDKQQVEFLRLFTKKTFDLYQTNEEKKEYFKKNSVKIPTWYADYKNKKETEELSENEKKEIEQSAKKIFV